MEREFDDEGLRKKLNRLEKWKRLAFILGVCERMLPSYSRFTKETGFGDPAYLRFVIDEAWKALETSSVPPNAEQLAEKAEALAPDTEDFSTLHTSAALDAAVSISLLMRAFKGGELDIAVEVASLVRDTVDMYVQQVEDLDPNDPGLERKILVSRLMQAELRRQREDVEFLNNLSLDVVSALPSLRSRWANSKMSCLDLSSS